MAALTVIWKGPTEADSVPSETETVIFVETPMSALVGVPLSLPLAVSKFAHAGMFVIEKVSVWPSASAAVGWKTYAMPAVMVVGGVPLICGGVLGRDAGAVELDVCRALESLLPLQPAAAAAMKIEHATARNTLTGTRCEICTLSTPRLDTMDD